MFSLKYSRGLAPSQGMETMPSGDADINAEQVTQDAAHEIIPSPYLQL